MKKIFLLLWFGCLSLPFYYVPGEGPAPAAFCPAAYGQPDVKKIEAEQQGFWDRLKELLNRKKEAETSMESVTEKYGMVYNVIHREEIKLYDSLSKVGVTNWDQYQNIITLQKVAQSKNGTQLAPNIKVFGWHPYWMGDAYKSYRFDLLSYLAWFCYNIDPETGECTQSGAVDTLLKSVDLINEAHKHNCKVLLTITNHTTEGNASFLKSATAQNILMDNLIQLIRKGKLDGVDVNFENIGDGMEDELTSFLTALSQRLHKEGPQMVLSVDLPAYDYFNNYEIKRIQPWVDLFLVTGYDYYNGKSRTDGPVAPLFSRSGEFNIRHSVDKYLQAGLQREKMILGLPYYGALWTSATAQAGTVDSNLHFVQHMTYRALKARYCTKTPAYDMESWSAYYTVFNPDSNYYEKCWFDDSTTLKRKYDWVLEQQLAGIGVWALGYDNGYPELWNLIEKTYAADTVLVYKDAYLEQKVFKLPRSLAQYRSLIAVAGIFIVVFLFAGLMIALFDWRVREVFFQHKTLRLLYAVSAVAILFSVYAFYLYVTGKHFLNDKNLPSLGLGLIIGAAIALLVGYWFDRRRMQLP